jgi:hypothetical protein
MAWKGNFRLFFLLRFDSILPIAEYKVFLLNLNVNEQ